MSFLFKRIKFQGHLTLALKLYIVVAATERATTDSFWENRMSNLVASQEMAHLQ